MNPIRWLWNVLVTADLAFNTVILASHDAETLSKRAAKARDKGQKWGCVLCALLDRIDRGHCDEALNGP